MRDENDHRLPCAARLAMSLVADQIEALARQIGEIEREIVQEAKRDDMRRLATIPGAGVITAASIMALLPDPAAFKFCRLAGINAQIPIQAEAKSG
ncbi:hypothetical protein D3C71_1003670 [compost metagenome]